jgi:hypothetical protein
MSLERRYDLHEKLAVFSFVGIWKMEFKSMFSQEDKLNEIANLDGYVGSVQST